jgi:hypothetical protein
LRQNVNGHRTTIKQQRKLIKKLERIFFDASAFVQVDTWGSTADRILADT